MFYVCSGVIVVREVLSSRGFEISLVSLSSSGSRSRAVIASAHRRSRSVLLRGVLSSGGLTAFRFRTFSVQRPALVVVVRSTPVTPATSIVLLSQSIPNEALVHRAQDQVDDNDS